MIIISTLACVIGMAIIIYSIREGIFTLNKRKNLIYEEEIILVNKEKEVLHEKLLLINQKVKLINYEQQNSPHTIKILENTYKEKKLEEEKYLEQKYLIQFKKNEKIIINNIIKHMFDEDIKNIFSNYSCNIVKLEQDLENFFNE
jgi:hypothetical protein